MVQSKKNRSTVLHVIAINGIGGAENLLLQILPALQNDIDITCLIFYRNLFVEEAHSIGINLFKSGIQVHYKKYKNVSSKNNLRFFVDFIKLEKPDLIHSHLKHADLWLSILKWQKVITIPVITTLHGYRDSYHNKYGLAWKGKAKRSLYYWITKFICTQLDGFILISHGLQKLYESAGLLRSKNICVIHHGTIINDLDFVKKENFFNYQIALPGRLVKFKGHKYLIEAISKLKPDFPDISAHFYGIGPEMEQLKKMVASKKLQQTIYFHGFVKDVFRKMQQHDIAVIPSIGEPFGLVFFDAFRANLPVIAFDLPASNEVIQDGYNGLLASPLDSDSLVQKINLLFKDRELRERLSQNAKKKLYEQYTIERMANDYLQFYQSFTKKIESNQLCVE